MFRDRREAAHRLARELRDRGWERPLVLAVPRGALPMGEILADALGGELDVVLVHKLGAPGNPEYAIGSVTEDGDVELRPEAREPSLPAGYVEQEARRQLAVLRRRRELYTPWRGGTDPAGRTVIVVDDGVATGATLEAALRSLRRRRPRLLAAAIAVAPRGVVERLGLLADEVVCLESPALFFAVGQFFASFDQVSDEEVVAILRRRARAAAATEPARDP